MGIALGGSGLPMLKHLADEIEAVAARDGDRGEAVPKVMNADIVVEPGRRPHVARMRKLAGRIRSLTRDFGGGETAGFVVAPKRLPSRSSHPISHRIPRYAVGCAGMIGRRIGHEISDFTNGAIQKRTGRDGWQRITKPLHCHCANPA
jgi:hypothetical protein